MLRFGGKSFVPEVAQLVLNQTTALLVAGFLGPGGLAVYARPRALLAHVRKLVSKYAFVLTPTASALQATGKVADIRRLLFDASRSAVYMSLPMILFLIIMGGPILRVWMGPDYEEGSIVLVILGAGFIAGGRGTPTPLP